MKVNPFSCEKKCGILEIQSPTEFIVITGGPGAGKTALLEFVRKILCERIAILPEAASILFGGGFLRLTSNSAKQAEQRAIYHIQNEMQNMVSGERQWLIGLCDRGTLDGLAYWPSSEIDFCAELKTSIENEYLKYKAVIHLSSPDSKGGYNFQNPLRIESADEAHLIDLRINQVWRGHPNYTQISSKEEFLDKVHEAASIIESLLPESCKMKKR